MLLIIHDGPALYRMLIVFTVVALAVRRAKNARLEALTVFLEASRFLAGTAL